jgi:DNA gyrase B subunit insert domain
VTLQPGTPPHLVVTPVGLFGAGAVVRHDDKEQAIDSFKQAINWLLDEARRELIERNALLVSDLDV